LRNLLHLLNVSKIKLFPVFTFIVWLRWDFFFVFKNLSIRRKRSWEIISTLFFICYFFVMIFTSMQNMKLYLNIKNHLTISNFWLNFFQLNCSFLSEEKNYDVKFIPFIESEKKTQVKLLTITKIAFEISVKFNQCEKLRSFKKEKKEDSLKKIQWLTDWVWKNEKKNWEDFWILCCWRFY